MRQGFDRNTLPFKAPLQPFAAWYAMISCLVICIVRICPFLTRLPATHCPAQFSGWSVFLKGQWDTATFITNYLPCAPSFCVLRLEAVLTSAAALACSRSCTLARACTSSASSNTTVLRRANIINPPGRACTGRTRWTLCRESTRFSRRRTTSRSQRTSSRLSGSGW
jgi:hypothetical protein